MPSKKKAKLPAPKATRPHMPGYGIATSKKGMLTWNWAAKNFNKSRQYWIVTVRPDRRPHVMVVWGLFMNNIFYFSTGGETRKAKNLAKNAHCAIANEDANTAIFLEGVAEIEKDVPLIKKFIKFYGRKYKWDMSAMAGDMISLKQPTYAVYPTVVFAQIEKTFTKTATRWTFKSRSR